MLNDQEINVSKIIVEDPLAIGGTATEKKLVARLQKKVLEI